MPKSKPEPYATVRIWAKTRHALRLLAAVQNLSMVECLDRAINYELKRERMVERFPRTAKK